MGTRIRLINIFLLAVMYSSKLLLYVRSTVMLINAASGVRSKIKSTGRGVAILFDKIFFIDGRNHDGVSVKIEY